MVCCIVLFVLTFMMTYDDYPHGSLAFGTSLLKQIKMVSETSLQRWESNGVSFVLPFCWSSLAKHVLVSYGFFQSLFNTYVYVWVAADVAVLAASFVSSSV